MECLCVCGVALAAVAIGVGKIWQEQDAVDTAGQPSMAQQITGAQDLTTFLAGYGLEVDPTSAEVTAVKIPRKWDESFEAFHDVVKQSGFELTKCKNKEVDKWVVPVPAQSTEELKTYAVVLVYQNEPKGAYLLQKPSGEVLPLTPKTASTAALTEEEIAANAGFGESAVTQETAAQTEGEVSQETAAQPEGEAGQEVAAQPEQSDAQETAVIPEDAYPTD
mgnify:FL=1